LLILRYGSEFQIAIVINSFLQFFIPQLMMQMQSQVNSRKILIKKLLKC